MSTVYKITFTFVYKSLNNLMSNLAFFTFYPWIPPNLNLFPAIFSFFNQIFRNHIFNSFSLSTSNNVNLSNKVGHGSVKTIAYLGTKRRKQLLLSVRNWSARLGSVEDLIWSIRTGNRQKVINFLDREEHQIVFFIRKSRC